MTDNAQLSELIQQEARKAGASPKTARKAMKKMQSGGMMSQIASALESSLLGMDPTATPRDRLRAKLRGMKEGRLGAEAKAAKFEDMREKVHEQQEQEKEEKKREAQRKRNKAKAYRRRLRDLEAEVGKISLETYNICLQRLHRNEYTKAELDAGQLHRDKAMIDLYALQSDFTETVSMDDMDDMDDDSATTTTGDSELTETRDAIAQITESFKTLNDQTEQSAQTQQTGGDDVSEPAQDNVVIGATISSV